MMSSSLNAAFALSKKKSSVACNHNHLLLTKLEEVSQSARQVALFRMECLTDNEAYDTKETSRSSRGTFNTTEGLAQELVKLLVEAMEGKEDVAGDSRDEVSSSSLSRVLPILEDITKTDQTLAEEVACCLCSVEGLLERLLQVVSSSKSAESDSSSSSEVVEGDLVVLARNITTRFAQLTMDEGDDKKKNGVGCAGDSSKSGGSFSKSELVSRLPLLFSMPQKAAQEQKQNNNRTHRQSEDMKIMVHKSTSAEESEQHHDVGLVMWPSAVMLARHIVQNPHLVLDSVTANSNNGGTILELGAGCGLVGLTAATLLVQQQHSHNSGEDDIPTTPTTNNPNLFLTDYNPQVLLNLKRNVHLNDLDGYTSVVGLDFFDQQPPTEDEEEEEKQDLASSSFNNSDDCWIDMEGIRHPQVDLILAADIICYSNDAELVANTIRTALNPKGGKAIVLGPTEDHRFGLQYFAEACRNCGLQVTVSNLDCSIATTSSSDSDYHNHQQHQRAQQQQQDHLDHDLEQTSGFHQGYNLTMFTIECSS